MTEILAPGEVVKDYLERTKLSPAQCLEVRALLAPVKDGNHVSYTVFAASATDVASAAGVPIDSLQLVLPHNAPGWDIIRVENDKIKFMLKIAS